MFSASGYMDLTDEEARPLQQMPVLFNMARAFIFPPTRKESGGWEIKVARNAFGYAPNDSIPSEFGRLPQPDLDALHEYLEACLPDDRFKSRPLRQRMCWYFDTVNGDFIGDYHPTLRGLFVATGGSGHGFKFLPCLGEKMANVLDGSDWSKSGGQWIRKWRWPPTKRDSNGDVVREVWCHDGSRAGGLGVKLQDAFAGDRRGVEIHRSKL